MTDNGGVLPAIRRAGRSIYPHLPYWGQNFLVSLEGARLQWRRYGGGYDAIHRGVERRAQLGRNELETERRRRLAEFLQASRRAPYWRDQFERHGVSVEKDPETELSKLPIVEKETVRRNRDAISTGPASDEERVEVRTSGTTGSGLVFETTLTGEREQWATWWRYRSWHGVDRGTWRGYFGGRLVVPVDQEGAPFWRLNLPGKQVMFSTFHIRASTAPEYAERIKRDRLPWLHGYPSALALLGHFVVESDLGPFPCVEIVTTGAESLLSHQRDVIQDAFGAPVREHYGLAEAVANFSECPEGRLHVDEDFSFVEFVPMDGADQYRIVGTNWTNPAFPLLRYDTGDVARIGSDGCECGRLGRVVEEVDGRREDYLVLEDGTRLGRLDHIFKGLGRIREAQLYQPEVGELIVKVVKGTGYDEEREEEELQRKLDQRLGDRIDYRIAYVDRVERSSRGKIRFVVSEVDGPAAGGRTRA